MGSISSLSRAFSGLNSHQQALNVTAHNLANINTPGYVRQQALYKDSRYTIVGRNETTLFQLGMGTDIHQIRQVRDMFIDRALRSEVSRHNFFEAKSQAVNEIETILGEVEGESFSKTLNQLWESMNELVKHPDSLETRGLFVQNAVLFAEKANLVGNQLAEYQKNLNLKIGDKVQRINAIGHEIYELNEVISREEIGGAQANDYRDQRNRLIDELSGLVNTRIHEDVHNNVLVTIENVPFVTLANVNEVAMIESKTFSDLSDPYWPHLSQAGPPRIIHKLINLDNPIGPEYDNEKGEIKGLIVSRGTRRADYTDLVNPTFDKEVKSSPIMTAQAQFDNLIHGIATMINDVLSPNTTGVPPMLDTAKAPYGLDGSQGIEIFKRKYMDRYDAAGHYNVEDPTNKYSLYSAGNIEVNKEILINYNKLCLSVEVSKPGDSSVVQSLINKWQKPFSALAPGNSGQHNYTEYYNRMVAYIGNIGESADNQVKNQKIVIQKIDNRRKSLMAVSQDEELGNLIKYQHAYNASARIVTVVDSMIDRLINQTGTGGR